MLDNKKMARILIVEDQEIWQKQIVAILGEHDSVTAKSFDEGVKALNENVFDLIILDVVIEGRQSGIDLCAHIRRDQTHQKTQILILSEKDTGAEKAAGLDIGADDYLPKKNIAVELKSRVQARLRRAEVAPLKRVVGFLEFNFSSRKVKDLLSGKTLPLSEAEFRVFLLLADNPQRIFSNDEISQKTGVAESRLRTIVSSLRKIVMSIGAIRRIKNEGYVYNALGAERDVS